MRSIYLNIGSNRGDSRALVEEAVRREAQSQGVKVLCLPELCLTGYTCGDLFLQDALLRGAEEALKAVLEATREVDMLIALGLPVRCRGGAGTGCGQAGDDTV